MPSIVAKVVFVVAIGCACPGIRAGDFAPVDLTPFTNQLRSERLGRTDLSHLKELPGGLQMFDEKPFLIGDGLLILESQTNPDRPDVVREIPINRRAQRLHIVQGCAFGANEGPKSVKDSTEIGEYVVRYDDGSTVRLPIVYGDNVRDWWFSKDPSVPNAKVVWETTTTSGSDLKFKRLYLVSWTNPTPQTLVKSVDFASRKETVAAAPFCVAMTVETPDFSGKGIPLPIPMMGGLVAKDLVPQEAVIRLAELEQSCDRLLAQRATIVPQRTPLLSTIESATKQIVLLNQANAALSKQYAPLEKYAKDLRSSRDRSKDANERATLSSQLSTNATLRGRLSAEHAQNSAEIRQCITDRDGAARELERLNGELLRCWNELEVVRGTRFDLFGTEEKHLRGQDSVVRAQCERWLLKDTFWLDAYFWAALSAVEMGDLDAAVELVERGKRAAGETAESLGRKAQSGRIHALSGLVGTVAMSQKKRGAEDLKAAMRVTLNERKEADWMVFVLASRVAMERDKNYARANTYLTRAAELKQSPIVRLWRARLQTVSPAGAAESDPAAGIRTLDEFWTGGSEQSWHVGLYLVEAHLAQGARDPAMTTWEKVRLLMTEAQRADVGKAIDEKLGAM